MTLLQSDRFRALSSVIVYCHRRGDTERVAALLRTCLREAWDLRPGGEVSRTVPCTRPPTPPHIPANHLCLPPQASPRLSPRPTTPACVRGSGSACNRPSWRAGCGWWWPRWLSGWGWTGQTCGLCCTWGCLPASRATCRLWAGPDVTASLHTATSSCSPRFSPAPLKLHPAQPTPLRPTP